MRLSFNWRLRRLTTVRGGAQGMSHQQPLSRTTAPVRFWDTNAVVALRCAMVVYCPLNASIIASVTSPAKQMGAYPPGFE